MFRNAVRVFVVAGLVGIGWAVGYAQSPTPQSAVPPALSGSSDFELLVSVVDGQTELRCMRGCRLTWAPTPPPKDAPVDMLAPDVKVRGVLSQSQCLAPAWMAQNCHILGWKR